VAAAADGAENSEKRLLPIPGTEQKTPYTVVFPVYGVYLLYQITIRLEGARYMPSVFLTWKAAYHSGKFLGGILVRR